MSSKTLKYEDGRFYYVAQMPLATYVIPHPPPFARAPGYHLVSFSESHDSFLRLDFLHLLIGMVLAGTATGVDGAFTSIPIIDLSKCDTPDGKLTTAYEIRDACIRVGFFYIRNYGISQSCLDNILSATKTYFALPIETKMKLNHRAFNFKGYSPLFDANLDPTHNDKGDFHEAFEIGWEEIESKAHDEKRENDGAMAGANVWPSGDCPGFREAYLAYYHAAISVGKTLFPLFALALELPETYFDDKTRNAAAIMRVLHYPSQDGHPDIDDDTPGIGAHSDFECFTILWQQPGIQALQVMNSEKKWIEVPAIDDTLVINIGDQLAMWTNGVFRSTVHRAINKSGKERYSIPLFFGTDYHVNIEPMPSCISADRPARYSPITAGEYVHKRLKEAYHAA